MEMSAEVATEKKTCRRSEGVDSSSSSVYCHVHRNPIPSKDNPPPGFCQWLHTFQVIVIVFHNHLVNLMLKIGIFLVLVER